MHFKQITRAEFVKLDLNQKKNILVVDDDPLVIFIVENILKNRHHVHGVSNGYGALKAVEENNFDIILMDINLGDINMDGIKTMRMIKRDKRYADIRIIAITSYSTNKKWYTEQGFDGLFVKPIIKDQIIELINNLLGKPGASGAFEARAA